MDSKRAEKLSPGQVSQLAPCPERGPDDVRHDEDRQDGALCDGPGNPGPASGLLLPRFGPPGYEQCVPVEDGQPAGHPVHHQHDGAPSLRSVRDDTELGGQ